MKKIIYSILVFTYLFIGLASHEAFATPTLNYGSLVVYNDSRDPTSNEPDVINNIIPNWLWWNTATNNFFLNINPDNTNLTFTELVTSDNISGFLHNNAWVVSSQPLAFNTPRTPSTTNNVTVIGSFNQSSTVLTAAIVQAQLNLSGTWTTIATASLSGLLTSQTNSITFDVPKNTQYRYISASGSNSQTSNFETIK